MLPRENRGSRGSSKPTKMIQSEGDSKKAGELRLQGGSAGVCAKIERRRKGTTGDLQTPEKRKD